MSFRSSLFFASLALSLVLLPPRAEGAEGRTLLSEESWVSPEQVPGPKVIYGTDDRLDAYEITDPDTLRWSAATCGLLRDSDLSLNADGSYALDVRAFRIGGRPACTGEPFGEQPVVMFCSGFLVGDDLIATAGHCYDEGDISTVRFVFGFKMEDADTPVLRVSAHQVYSGVEVISQALAGEFDYAVVRVDRPVVLPNVAPYVLRRSGSIAVGEPVGVIGHPSGLPLKISFGENTTVRESAFTGYFTANLDTYGGNSGSPVINLNTGMLEGILVRGAQDYVLNATCFRSNVLADSAGSEDVSRAMTFDQFVPDTDADELADDWENRFSLDAGNDLGIDGRDGDGDLDTLTNLAESLQGTHPGRADSDFDGVSDVDEITVGSDPRGAAETHSADTNHNFRFSLSEALRVVQLYRAGIYHCAAGTEDGFAPGSGDVSCNFHHSDYAPQDRVIDLPEMQRTVALFEAGGYGRDVATEDSFTSLP